MLPAAEIRVPRSDVAAPDVQADAQAGSLYETVADDFAAQRTMSLRLAVVLPDPDRDPRQPLVIADPACQEIGKFET